MQISFKKKIHPTRQRSPKMQLQKDILFKKTQTILNKIVMKDKLDENDKFEYLSCLGMIRILELIDESDIDYYIYLTREKHKKNGRIWYEQRNQINEIYNDIQHLIKLLKKLYKREQKIKW